MHNETTRERMQLKKGTNHLFAERIRPAGRHLGITAYEYWFFLISWLRCCVYVKLVPGLMPMVCRFLKIRVVGVLFWPVLCNPPHWSLLRTLPTAGNESPSLRNRQTEGRHVFDRREHRRLEFRGNQRPRTEIILNTHWYFYLTMAMYCIWD